MKHIILPTLFIHRSFSVGGLLILLFSLTTSAQSFQWAKRGGGTNTMQGQYNDILEMTTDEADNIYMLGKAATSNLQVDGHPLKGYAPIINGAPNILISSFTKEGQYRWSKVFWGSLAKARGLAVKNGFVYVSGLNLPNDSAFFSTDTTYYHAYNGKIPKAAFLIQYDTLGNYQWLQMPGTDTISYTTNPYVDNPYWIDVAPNGDVYWLCQLRVGDLPNTNQPITQEGSYVLRYSQGGQYISRTRLDIERYDRFFFADDISEGNFIRNHQTGDFYIGATNPGRSIGQTWQPNVFTIGGDTIKNRMYLAVFDSTGQVKWKKTGKDTTLATYFNDLRLDSMGNLLLTGQSENGRILINNILFSSTEVHVAPFIIKLDNGGNTLWAKFGVASGATPAHRLALSGTNEVAITGDHGSLYFQGANDLDTFKIGAKQTYEGFIARFDNQTGDLLGMVSAQTNFAGASYGKSITADSEGSYYLGGNFDQQLFLGPDTLYKIGGPRSFFVTKYACGIPEADFTVSNDSVGYYFTYTGTPADSVLWDFGDGSAPYKGDSVSHVYSAKGQFIVCATAYDGCGDTTRCDTLDVTTIDLNEYPFAEKAKLFQLAPNPATSEVSVIYELPEWTETSTGSLEVHDLRGARVAEYPITRGVGTEHVQLANWTASVYIIILRVDGEVKDYRRLVIQ